MYNLPVDGDWRAPHQNSVTHVDPHAPLAGLPPGEGKGNFPCSNVNLVEPCINPKHWYTPCLNPKP